MMTLDETMIATAGRLDEIIAIRLDDLAQRIRRDMKATAPANDAALDVSDPESAWQSVSVEQIVDDERQRLIAWKDSTLAEIRAFLVGGGKSSLAEGASEAEAGLTADVDSTATIH